jgi:cyclopropane fatty-acyl-phospholipid synthase-like methyltransferase
MLDVPSPIDLRSHNDANEWAATAMEKRPWRKEFFECFASQLEAMSPNVRSILELGSGPGFLAEHILQRISGVSYTALDFSLAMHDIAQRRLTSVADRVNYIERDFKDLSWNIGLGQYDAVITNQAVHELRHKRHAKLFHEQVLTLLQPNGIYLVCDHFVGEGGMKNDQLFMTVEEQKAALISAGFDCVEQVLLKGGMVLHKATI